ncbi:MAG TPA: hypothetical protein DCZ40_08845 [Lachnospiraceae bacterium]|nr:hypothetical protein [Lachnospiraceae bacterium]
MNINKYTSKAMAVMLCMAMVFSSPMPSAAAEMSVSGNVAYADNTDSHAEWDVSESRYEDIEVTYSQGSSYHVTIPKTIALDANKQSSYSVKVEGDIAANKQVCVVPVDGIDETEVLDFYMRDQTEGSAKEAVPAEINQSKFYWDSSEAAASYEETSNYIVAEGLSAGSWKGIFQMEISLRTDTSHIHNYVGEITKEPTCTETGEKTYTCDCGDSYTEEIPAKGHHYVDGKCTDCGQKDPDHTHSYTESITKEPTCTEAGEKTYTCGCGDSYTEEIPAKGHNYKDGICSECGEKDPDHKHSYTESITKEPTCTEAGEKTYTCGCGDSYTEAVPATGKHNYVDGTCTDCGAVDDPYAVGSSQALMDWYYTLDETNNTVTLTNLRNNLNNVVAYSSYELNGKVYRTKIGSAVTNKTASGLIHDKSAVKTVAFGNSIDFSDTTNMSYMFLNCGALTEVDFGSGFDTGNVTSMKGMFQGCKMLEKADVSSFNTSSVENMSNMFNNCQKLKDIDVSSFDTGNVTQMDYMFSGCSALETIDVGSFDTGKVTSMNYMFGSCSSLRSINAGNFNTENVETMNAMFGASGLESLDISRWNTKKVKNIGGLCNGCTNLEYVNMNNLDLSSATTLANMFYKCSSLKNVDLENTKLNTGAYINMGYMFDGCSSLELLDLTSWDTGKVTNMQQMFYLCSSLKTIYADQNLWSTKTANTTNMFASCGTSAVTYK